MALALDRDAIQQVVMRGKSVPGAQNAPPFVNGYDAATGRLWRARLRPRQGAAGRGGLSDGFSVDLHCPNDRYMNDEAICQAFTGMLGRIGIKANLVSQSRTITSR
jgi:peptide/nickel transport system substrate-binding protein